jgi:signal transduction histidine kinase
MARRLADRLREARRELAQAWLEAILQKNSAQPSRAPSQEMVDGMPFVIDGIAWHLEHPDQSLGVDSPVIHKAMQLGALRHRQGFTARDILEEYELLGRVLFDHLAQTVGGDGGPKTLACGSLLFHAIVVIEITTTTHYLEMAAAQVAEREERLRAFNRAVSHEVKNRIGAVASASALLANDGEMSRDDRSRFAEIIARNTREMRATVENLLVLARIEDDPRSHPHLPLKRAIDNVVEQVHTAADAAHVTLHVDENLPDVEVDDAVLEVSLANYMRNAIAYADRTAPERVVDVHVCIDRRSDDGPELVVRVADNGIGVPAEKREGLFKRFFRAHEKTHPEGTGLGLSIVRASVTAVGGRAWAEFPEKGSVFAFAIPLRDAA